MNSEYAHSLALKYEIYLETQVISRYNLVYPITIFAKDNLEITVFLDSDFTTHRRVGSVLITTVCCLALTLATLEDSDTGVADSCINLPSAIFSSSCTSSPLMDLRKRILDSLANVIVIISNIFRLKKRHMYHTINSYKICDKNLIALIFS